MSLINTGLPPRTSWPYDICDICFWEDDSVQLRWPGLDGGANGPSLIQSQRNFVHVGAMEQRFVELVRKALSHERLDPGWRPVDPCVDQFETGGMRRAPWPKDLTTLYWWRPTFWRAGPLEPKAP